MQLKATPDQLREDGKKMVSNAEAYLAAVKELYAAVDGLKATWQGSDNQQFAATVGSYKENIDALGKVMGNYGVFLQETGNSLEKLQADIANQASAL